MHFARELRHQLFRLDGPRKMRRETQPQPLIPRPIRKVCAMFCANIIGFHRLHRGAFHTASKSDRCLAQCVRPLAGTTVAALANVTFHFLGTHAQAEALGMVRKLNFASAHMHIATGHELFVSCSFSLSFSCFLFRFSSLCLSLSLSLFLLRLLVLLLF